MFPYLWDNIIHYYQPKLVISPNQIEPSPSMFKQFVINNLGRDPKTFNLQDFWEFEKSIKQNKINNTGSTLPIFMSKIDYLRVGGWDENYEQGMVSDWDFFLKCQLSGLKMSRIFDCNFYHKLSFAFML